MNKILYVRNKIIGLLSLAFFLSIESWAQMPSVYVPQQQQAPSSAAPEDDTWWYVTLFLLSLGLIGAVIWWKAIRKTADYEPEKTVKNSNKSVKSERRDENLAAEREREWYRKNQKSEKPREADNYPKNFPRTSAVLSENANLRQPVQSDLGKKNKDEVKEAEFSELPIASFTELKKAQRFDALPLSNDPALLSAVEQSSDEFEEDEEVRDLALRILAAFKTKNSAESLGQIAHYDLSANLRSKAVSALADFDHESVFENVLLACADPTREVRAAAARGLFRLSFDRADAWTRIFETKDEFQMRQAARAAVEADLVERSFDRLIHADQKIAYEAFALIVLLIKAGETEKIFNAIENHRNQKVKLALLHVLQIANDESALPYLYALLENNAVSADLKQKADEAIKSFEMVAV